MKVENLDTCLRAPSSMMLLSRILEQQTKSIQSYTHAVSKHMQLRVHKQKHTIGAHSVLITIVIILRHQAPIPPRRQILLQTPITLRVHVTYVDTD